MIITHCDNITFDETLLELFYKKQEILDKLRNENIYDIIPDYRKLSIS